MKHFKIVFGAVVFMTVFAGQALAQNAPNDPFEAMRRRMEAMQKQMMQQFDLNQNPFGDQGFRWDSTFNFRLDTSFSDGNGSFFFHFGGPGADTTFQYGTGDFWGFERLFDDLFQQPFGQPQRERPSEKIQEEEDMLPEERLRLEEQKGKKEAAPAPKKTKLKTIRV